MTISGINPYSALPTSTLASMSGIQGGQLTGAPLSAQAALGAQEKPGIGRRLLNAMRSAISELRGTGPSSQPQTLAMQSPLLPSSVAPVAVKKPGAKAKFPNAKTYKDKVGNVRQVGTGKILKPAANAAAAAPQPAVGTQLPSNAVQMPGATVYSYDQNGNPVAPTMQQLGMTPTMLQGLEGIANQVDPSGPQVNATNQNSLGLGTGLGMGTAVPVLGQPILTTAPTPASAGASTGGTQAVKNENVTDISSNNRGVGYGWGSGGWGGMPFGGVATPAAPYGASMLGTNGSRWF